MPELTGMDLISAVRAEGLPCGVILLTAYGDIDLVRSVMKAGADDFLTKPYEPDRLRLVVARTLEQRALIDELEGLRQDLRREYRFHDMVSKSPKMRRVFDLIKQVGPLGSTVLIQGETGTGKELVARAVHASDTRRRGPFVALNCAALNESLLETELFGHERGAFTGAEQQKKGRFELADGGTLFLDEIGEISPGDAVEAPPRAPDGHASTGSAAREAIAVDVRIIAATNKRLDDEVKAGRFRQDLFFRIAVIRVDAAAPARADGGRAAAGDALPRGVLEAEHAAGDRDPGRGDAGAARLPLAGEHPRAAERDPRRRGDGRRRRDPPRVAARRRSSPAPSGPHGGADMLIDIDRPLRELTGDLIARVEREYFTRLLARCKGNVARAAKHSRALAAERHPEAPEVRAGPDAVQAAARKNTERPESGRRAFRSRTIALWLPGGCGRP